MRLIVRIVALFLLVAACNPSKTENQEAGIADMEGTKNVVENEVWHIDFPEYIDNKKDLYLSDIAESLSYIQMETSNEYLIGEKGLSVKPCGEFIFIGQHNSPVGVFDRTGKFIRTIGRIGKGPEEFNNDYLFYPEENRQKVIFANAFRASLMEYSWDGEFIREIVPAIRPSFFVPVNHDHYLIWAGMQKEDSIGFYRLAFVDSEGQIVRPIYEDMRKIGQSRVMMVMSPLITDALNGMVYNSWEEDLIYRILPDTIIEPVIEWDLGKYKMPFNAIEDYDRFAREKHKFIRDINAVEGQNSWYLKYYYTKDLEMAVFDKTSAELFTVKNPDLEQKGVYNDIDGGPSFWPFWDAEKGAISYKMISAIDLLSNQSENLNYQGTPNDPVATEQYQSLIKNLKPTDNPILIKVKLK